MFLSVYWIIYHRFLIQRMRHIACENYAAGHAVKKKIGMQLIASSQGGLFFHSWYFSEATKYFFMAARSGVTRRPPRPFQSHSHGSSVPKVRLKALTTLQYTTDNLFPWKTGAPDPPSSSILCERNLPVAHRLTKIQKVKERMLNSE